MPNIICKNLTGQSRDQVHETFHNMRKDNSGIPVVIGTIFENRAYIWLAVPSILTKRFNAAIAISSIANLISSGDCGYGNEYWSNASGEKVEGLQTALYKLCEIFRNQVAANDFVI